jgi:hypothetical protein
MKGFPYSWVEITFIGLIIVLPLTIGIFWSSETALGFIGKVGASMAVGICIWLTLIFASARAHDRKRRRRNSP